MTPPNYGGVQQWNRLLTRRTKESSETTGTATVRTTSIGTRKLHRSPPFNLVEHTTRYFGYSSEITQTERDATWTITITCDPTRKDPRLEPKSILPDTRSFDERDLEYGRKNAEKLVENLRRMKVSEYEESLTDEYGTWSIVACWSGTLTNDPR
jgi:hypothetical protein